MKYHLLVTYTQIVQKILTCTYTENNKANVKDIQGIWIKINEDCWYYSPNFSVGLKFFQTKKVKKTDKKSKKWNENRAYNELLFKKN